MMDDDAVVEPRRGVVFVSYSHRDREPWLRRLLVLLEPVVRNRFVQVWADEYIPVGDGWRRNIADAIDRAELALLLVSGDFLGSRFIMQEELPALIERGVRLAPVLLSECLWEAEPLLAGVQWIHDPGRDGPLNRHFGREGERDRRLVEICRRLLNLLPEDRGPTVIEGGWDKGRASAAQIVVDPLAASTVRGALNGVPALPPGYLAREELVAAVDAVIDAGTGAVGVAAVASVVGLQGQGGIGKSVLAATLARDERIRNRFPDGVYWVTVGERANLVAVQLDLLARLGRADAVTQSVSAGAQLLREVLADRRVLLIVDDVWSTAAAYAFRVTGRLGRVLYTSRSVDVLESVAARVTALDVLSLTAAKTLAASVIVISVERLPVAADRALAATGRVPMAVALVAAAVRGGIGWTQALARLDAGSEVFLDHPFANTFKAMHVAISSLPSRLRTAYLSLAVYPRDTEIPVAAVARYWQQQRGISVYDATRELQSFAGAGLVRLAEGSVSLHDLQHDYLLLYADDPPLLHSDLLAAYRSLLPSNGDGWWQLPPDEPYIWDHLIFHLRESGELAELVATVIDLPYLAARIAQSGPHAAEIDLTTAMASAPTDGRLTVMREWITRRAHVFAGFNEATELAPTMQAWLHVDLPDALTTTHLKTCFLQATSR